MSFKASVLYNKKVGLANKDNPSNPMRLKCGLSNLATYSNFNQVSLKPKFDYDSMEILTKVDSLSKLIPKDMKIPYSFSVDDLNGERIYTKNGDLDCIREYDNEIVRDYIPEKTGKNVLQIIERDRTSGLLISKIERSINNSGVVKLNVTIYDDKINNKYTMLQIEDNSISNITEFYADGKKFRTLVCDVFTNKPLRYMEAKEDVNNEFVFTDAHLDTKGEVSEIKKVFADKEVCIKYSGMQKSIDVKRQIV